MLNKKKKNPDEKKEELTTQQKLDAILRESAQETSKELALLLERYGFTFKVTHVIQLTPKTKRQ